MDYQMVCPNANNGCRWLGSLHELEFHVKDCQYRPSQCFYCYNQLIFCHLSSHQTQCLRSRMRLFQELEDEISEKIYPVTKVTQPSTDEMVDLTVPCNHLTSGCTWKGLSSELAIHLQSCQLEKYRPTLPKRQKRLQ